jgi:DNA gyrase/topoisomerase IV subunit A
MEKYDLSEIQAEAILEMTLRRLTGLEVDKLKAELKELKKLIAELTKILKDPTVLNALIIEELEKIKQGKRSDELICKALDKVMKKSLKKRDFSFLRHFSAVSVKQDTDAV